MKKHNTAKWFKNTLTVKESILPRVIYRSLFCGAFGFGISLLDAYRYEVQLPILATAIPSVVIGLLLVFRTNTAYERFWEGRKLWSNIDVQIRNISRQILVIVEEQNPNDAVAKKQAMLLLAGFTISAKQRLQKKLENTQDQNQINHEYGQYLSTRQLGQLTNSTNIPADILLFLQDYLQIQMHKGNILVNQVSTIQGSINSLLDSSMGCERILRTPIPIAYSIHLKQLLLAYCLTLPFQFVSQLGLWTAPVVLVVSMALLGIEAIGEEIENPFGTDINDINMAGLCDDVVQGIQEIVELQPSSPTFKSNK